MCWCAQLMIQCETRLESVLWRFQIKSTLHNSLSTMEFFFKLLDGWRRDSNVFSREPSLPPPLGASSSFKVGFPRSGEMSSHQELGEAVFLEWDLSALGGCDGVRDGSQGQSTTLLQGKKPVVSRLWEMSWECTQPNPPFYLVSLYNSLKSGTHLKLWFHLLMF